MLNGNTSMNELRERVLKAGGELLSAYPWLEGGRAPSSTQKVL